MKAICLYTHIHKLCIIIRNLKCKQNQWVHSGMLKPWRIISLFHVMKYDYWIKVTVSSKQPWNSNYFVKSIVSGWRQLRKREVLHLVCNAYCADTQSDTSRCNFTQRYFALTHSHTNALENRMGEGIYAYCLSPLKIVNCIVNTINILVFSWIQPPKNSNFLFINN